MNSRFSKLLYGVTVCIPALFIATSGIAKISEVQPVLQKMTEVGMRSYITLLGTAEVLVALLFAFKPTIKIGFFLLCCYYSGAMATEISHGGNGIAPLVFILLACGSAFLRRKDIFSGNSTDMQTNGYEQMLSKSF